MKVAAGWGLSLTAIGRMKAGLSFPSMPRLSASACSVASFLALILLGTALSPALGAQAEAARVRVHAAFLDARGLEKLRILATKSLTQSEERLGLRIKKVLDFHLVRHEGELSADLKSLFSPGTVAIALTHRYQIYMIRERLLAQPPDNLRSVLAHEMTHIILGDLELELADGQRRMPLWFHEGLAQYLGGSWYYGGSEEIVAVRALSGETFGWHELALSFPKERVERQAAYAQAASYFHFLVGELGLSLLIDVAREYLGGQANSLDAALAGFVWQSFTELSAQWEKKVLEGMGLFALLERNCFNILLLFALPLLVLVFRRRQLREKLAGERMAPLDYERDNEQSYEQSDEHGDEQGDEPEVL